MSNGFDLPAKLPPELERYGKAASLEILFEMLSEHPDDFIAFIELACVNETWSGTEHQNFTKKSLSWVTARARQEKLNMAIVYELAEIFLKHHKVINPLLERDVAVELTDKVIYENSMLLSAQSDYFRVLLQAKRGKKRPKFSFNLSSESFRVFDEYINTGGVEKLWIETQESLRAIISQARRWELEELALMCEDVLKRYIDRTNVFQILLESHRAGWPVLRDYCIDFINRLDLGIYLYHTALEVLSCRLQNFRERALDSFKKIDDEVTRILLSRDFTEEQQFLELLKGTSKLTSLDLSDTQRIALVFQNLPEKIYELILDNCGWLNAESLATIFATCTHLTHLHLASNAQLNISAWATLQKLETLIHLNIARCANVGDEELNMILLASRKLEELCVDECLKISPFGFTQLARGTTELRSLSAKKTNIDDGSLAELGFHCNNLVKVDVTDCENITSKGLRELVTGRSTLRFLKATGCGLSREEMQHIKKIRNMLTFVA